MDGEQPHCWYAYMVMCNFSQVSLLALEALGFQGRLQSIYYKAIHNQ